MEKTNITLSELKEFVRTRNFNISSIEDIENPLKDLDKKRIYYKKIDIQTLHSEEGYIDGYLLVEVEESPLLIPFYREGEVGGILLKQPRKMTTEDELLLTNAMKEIEETALRLKEIYRDIKKVLKK